jgi:iron complex outermembrane recepter protein
MINSNRGAMAVAIAAAMWGVADAAIAETALEEIVVTARKRAENLQQVPIAVTAFTESAISRAGIERQADFVALMPNVTLVNTANIGDTQLSIRGIVSTRDAESTFAYVVDGVLSTNPNSFNEELLDVQQIEVLKGPQGALYGRNAVAGAILVTTQEPGDEFEGKVKLGGGNNESRNGSLVLSGPLGENLRGRLAGSYRTTDGFYGNSFTGENDSVDYLEDKTLRGRLIWDASDDLKLDFRGGYSEADGGAINFNAVFAIPTFASVFGSDTFYTDVNDHDFNFTFNVPGENEQKTTELSLKADWALGWADMTAVFAYSDLEEYLLSDGTSATFYGYELTPACQNDRLTLNSFTRPDLFGPFFQPFGVLPPASAGGAEFTGVYGPYTALSCDGYQYQERNQEDLSMEVRFSSPQDQSLRWIGGVYAAQIEREVVVAYGADQGLGFKRQPYVDAAGPNPTDLLFWDEFDTTVYAVFGQIEFDLSDTQEVALAARFDREEREVASQVPNVASSGLNINLGSGPINPALATFPGGIPERDNDFEQFQPKLTWRWEATEELNVYASWGVGFRSGGFNSLGTEDLLNFWFNTGYGGPGETVDAGLGISDDYDKEVSETFELGFKSEFWDNRLRLNASVFHTTVDDNQFFEFFAGPFGLQRVVTTIDELEINGVELDFHAYLTNNISVFGGAGFLDSEIKENRNRPLTVGNDAPQAPKETYNLGAQFEMSLSDGVDFFVRLDWQYVGEMWFHTLQGEETPTIWQAFFFPGIEQNFSKASRDAYDTLNARIGVEGEQWSATLWGRNITDEEYLAEVIPAPEFGGSFIHPGARDSYGIDLVYRF